MYVDIHETRTDTQLQNQTPKFNCLNSIVHMHFTVVSGQHTQYNLFSKLSRTGVLIQRNSLENCLSLMKCYASLNMYVLRLTYLKNMRNKKPGYAF